MYSGSEIIFRNGENCQEVLCGRSLSLKVKKSRIKTFLGLFTTLRYVWPVTEAPTPLQRPHQSDKTQRQSRLHETVSYLINSSTLISQYTCNQRHSEKSIHAKIDFGSFTQLNSIP